MNIKQLLLTGAFLAGLLTSATPVLAQDWVLTSAPSTHWYSVALSADGAGILGLTTNGDIFLSTNSGASFNEALPAGQGWFEVAASADFSKWVAVNSVASDIYTSTNFGATWASHAVETLQTGGTQTWQNVASSGDGNVLIALATYEYVVPGNPVGIGVSGFNGFGAGEYIQTNTVRSLGFSGTPPFMGVKPIPQDGAGIGAIDAGGLFFGGYNYDAFTVYSAEYGFIFGGYSFTGTGNGTYAPFTAVSGSLIYTSTNGGLNWNQSGGSPDDLYNLALSANGLTFAVAGTSSMNTASSSLGTVVTEPPVAGNWVADAISADGTTLIGATFDGPICTSTNAGVTWTTNALPLSWASVACSADGSKMAAVNSGRLIFVSQDAGATWAEAGLPFQPANAWGALAMSADGNEFAATDGGSIWTRQTTPTPSLEVNPSSRNLGLSWLIPSINFTIQQSPDMVQWANAPISPILNVSNLHNEIILPPPSAGSMFYRLKH